MGYIIYLTSMTMKISVNNVAGAVLSIVGFLALASAFTLGYVVTDEARGGY